MALHSPDLASVDFFLFPKFETTFKVLHFDSMEAIQATVTLSYIPVHRPSSRRTERWRVGGKNLEMLMENTLKNTNTLYWYC